MGFSEYQLFDGGIDWDHDLRLEQFHDALIYFVLFYRSVTLMDDFCSTKHLNMEYSNLNLRRGIFNWYNFVEILL